ncbi:membrane protein [Vibrio nigripulchritudo]|uniref:DMT family transporter n=1 Tax=Vibrio nigripulchritudo TaxID=28173 RepID=UPI00190B73E0|nr:DMT family transporter [Vibrio nigripulchritudo]BCL69563.1 membrane protein [Vibrio nigripulchritudo]BDU30906.1 membrane protein [Vibrio nigripulchritudo]
MEKVASYFQSTVGFPNVSPNLKGYAVITLVLFIWTGFALSIRAIGSSPLATADVALIRFLVPVVLLLPFTARYLDEIKQVKMTDMIMILLGGVPFLFIASLGANYVPAAYVGTVLAGTPPFFVAVIGWLFFRNALSLKRVVSLALIMLGVAIMVVEQGMGISGEFLKGIAVLLCASTVWAVYTMSLKRSGLSPIAVTILISWCSLLITLALVLSGSVSSQFGNFSLSDALPFILVQGLCVGLFSTIGYSYAIRQLGSEQASIIGSLSPALTALAAVPVFGEGLTIAIAGGISLTVIGVILSNRS